MQRDAGDLLLLGEGGGLVHGCRGFGEGGGSTLRTAMGQPAEVPCWAIVGAEVANEVFCWAKATAVALAAVNGAARSGSEERARAVKLERDSIVDAMAR